MQMKGILYGMSLWLPETLLYLRTEWLPGTA